MDYNAIENKKEELIKADIKSKGLIKTGAMYNSIVVTADGQGDYKISAVDYFVYVDGNNDITKDVFSSKELNRFIEREYVRCKRYITKNHKLV